MGPHLVTQLEVAAHIGDQHGITAQVVVAEGKIGLGGILKG